MRDLLTLLASLLVLTLTAALVGPYLVDWSAQRAFIERRLSETLGAQVRVEGPISLTLLPTPSLSVADVSVSVTSENGPSLTAAGAAFELAAAPLMRGELQFIRADLNRPVLRLSLRPNGALTLPSRPESLPQQIDFEDVRLRDGALVITRGKGETPWTFTHLDLQAHADSLVGPFSGTGSIARRSGRLAFHFDAGARTGDSFPLQVSFSGEGLPSSSLTGSLRDVSGAGGAALSYRGQVTSSGVFRLAGFPDVLWRLTGGFSIDSRGGALQKGDLRLGDKAAIEAAVSGKAGFSQTAPIDLSFAAPQVDGDAFLASFGADAGSRLVSALADRVSGGSLFEGARPLRLSFSTPALTLGSDTVADARLDMSGRRDAPARVTLRAALPGDAHVAWDGTFEGGLAAALRGNLDLGTDDLGRFAAWLAPAFPDVAQRLNSLPFHAVAVKGDVDLSAAGFDSRELVLTADRTVLRGAAAYTEAMGSQRARLFADLRSDALDLDTLPDLSGSARAARDMDLAISLDARAVRLAHFGAGMVDAGRIALSLHKSGDNLRVDRLSLADIGGATLTASAAVDAQGARFDATLDAERLDELVAAVERVAPGPAASALASRAVALSPARLALHFQAVRGSDGIYRPVSVSLNGSARGATVEGALKPQAGVPDAVDVTFDLSGPDSTILLRQLGVGVLPLADAGPGHVQIRARTGPGGRLTGSAAASLAGSDLSFEGETTNWLTEPSARGRITVRSGDAAPLLRLLTFVLPDPSQSLPLSLDATVSAKPGALSFTDIAGSVAGDPISGAAELAASDVDAGARLTGAISLQRLSLATLAYLTLGPSATAPARGLWSKAKFAPGLTDPPATDLALSVKSFELAPGWTGSDASFRLKLASGLVSLESARMSLGEGALSGALALRRDGASATITTRVEAKGVRIDRPIASGVFDMSANFAATGASPLELADGLAGSGSATISDLRVARTAPDALARLLAASQDENFKVGVASVERALGQDLDRGALALKSTALNLQAAGGTLRLASASAQATNAPGFSAGVTFALDLRDLAIENRITLTSESVPKDWPDSAPPSIAIVWRAPNMDSQPRRSVEAEALIGDLSTRAAAQEAARIAALDFDIRERAFFMRRLKGLEFLHRREAEEAAWEAERAERARAAAAAQAAKAAKSSEQQAKTAPAAPSAPFVPLPAPPQPPVGLGQDPLSFGRF